ncbi:helix-turn-helix transcriptional regulator [Paraburkholderia caffeinilytica]|uniref:helix-turn-helix transcriptional regulator n=1 Tax=Paraburkholderia caffeinilytica TaxID=1761016 RepID=UPI003DA19CB8
MPTELLVELLTLSQLCPLLHRKPATVYADIAAKRFDRLPPLVRLPGQRKLLWRKQDVFEWIEQHVQPAVAAVADTRKPTSAKTQLNGIDPPEQRRQIGRPTKRQQLERLAAARGAR